MTTLELKERREKKELRKLKEISTLTENIYEARALRNKITPKQHKAILKKSKASTVGLKMSFKDPDNSLPEVENTIFFYSI